MSIFIKVLGILSTLVILRVHGAALPKTRKIFPKEYLKSIPQKPLPKKRIKPIIKQEDPPPQEEVPIRDPSETSLNEKSPPWESNNPETLEKNLAWIVRSKEVPWEELPNGERRKIYKEANIQLHLIQVVPTPKFPSLYEQNVTCYVIQGNVRVSRQDQEGKLAMTAGDTFFIPAGKSFTRESESPGKNAFLIEFFSPAHKKVSQQQEELSKNEVIGFVHRWFALLDQRADVSHFLSHLGNNIYKVSFTEPAITSKSQFQQWYQRKFLKTIYSNSYKINNIEIHTKNIQDGVYDVLLDITWIAKRKDKKDLENFYQEQWTVQKNLDIPLGFSILDYKVEQIPVGKRQKVFLKQTTKEQPTTEKISPKTTVEESEENDDLWEDEVDEDEEDKVEVEEEKNQSPSKSSKNDSGSNGFFENQPSEYIFSG